MIDTPFIYFHKNTLNDSIIERIHSLASSQVSDEAVLLDSSTNDMRKGSLKWLKRNSSNEWLYNTVSSIIEPVNNSVFNFDLSSIETIQYTQYINTGDKYDFHVDAAPAQEQGKDVRKLTMIIQLSNDEDYTGGDVEFMSGRKYNEKAPRAKGSIVIFPAFVMHKVNPIITGKRNSLVIWFRGPKFR